MRPIHSRNVLLIHRSGEHTRATKGHEAVKRLLATSVHSPAVDDLTVAARTGSRKVANLTMSSAVTDFAALARPIEWHFEGARRSRVESWIMFMGRETASSIGALS